MKQVKESQNKKKRLKLQISNCCKNLQINKIKENNIHKHYVDTICISGNKTCYIKSLIRVNQHDHLHPMRKSIQTQLTEFS